MMMHAFINDDDENVITDSDDDDDAFIDPGAFIEEDDPDYYQVFNFLCCT